MKESESAGAANLRSMATKSIVPTSSSSSTSTSSTSTNSTSTSVPGVPIRGAEVARLPPSTEENHTPFIFRSPMDNIVIRTFQFPLR